MRAVLNAVYRGAEAVGAACLVAIAVLILATIAGRLAGVAVTGLDEFAMYSMAAGLFLLLGPTFRRGAHIRVTLVIDRLPRPLRRGAEVACLGAGTALSAYFTWWWTLMTWDSYDFGDLSQGVVAIPLWIPQAAMGLGLLVLTVALLEDLAAALRGRPASYDGAVAQEG